MDINGVPIIDLIGGILIGAALFAIVYFPVKAFEKNKLKAKKDK